MCFSNEHRANCFKNMLVHNTFLGSLRSKAKKNHTARPGVLRCEMRHKSATMTELPLTGLLWF